MDTGKYKIYHDQLSFLINHISFTVQKIVLNLATLKVPPDLYGRERGAYEYNIVLKLLATVTHLLPISSNYKTILLSKY